MIPRDTVYRLAKHGDFRRCHALLRAENEDAPLTWLTVLAERHGNVIGVIGVKFDKFVTAGPLAVSKAITRPGIVVMRLVEAMENALRIAKVTAYWFHVSVYNKPWLAVLGRLGFREISATDTVRWYRREVLWAAPK